MSSSDVRDILELNQASSDSKTSKKKKVKKLIEPIKRPQGVHREVWGLIYKDDSDQPPLIPSDEPVVYKQAKAKLRCGVRKWQWAPFKNPARSDSAEFCHWQCANDEPNKLYPFAKFNKKINLLKYTEAEYAQYLSDESWSKVETDHLFDLCERFDLRFFIISDRWESAGSGEIKERSIDELKDRYYKVTGILQRLRQGDEAKVFVFDLEHEQKRREQLEKLFGRSKEQIDEENYLLDELKKIEIRKKERERKQQDVSKLLTAVVDLESISMSKQPSLQQSITSVKHRNSVDGNNKRVKQRKYSTQSNNNNDIKSGVNKLNKNEMIVSANNSNSNSLNNSSEAINAAISPASSTHNIETRETKNKKSLIFKAVVDSTGIKFPDNKTTGVTLRSYKMKLPQSVGQKKIKAIDQLLEELKIEPRPIATESICEQFNELRSDIVLLYELQQALASCEYEFQSLKHRFESIAPGKALDFGQLETSLTSSSSLLNSLNSGSTPQKRISEIFDVSFTPSGPMERRRRAALNQTNILKRLRGRNAT